MNSNKLKATLPDAAWGIIGGVTKARSRLVPAAEGSTAFKHTAII